MKFPFVEIFEKTRKVAQQDIEHLCNLNESIISSCGYLHDKITILTIVLCSVASTTSAPTQPIHHSNLTACTKLDKMLKFYNATGTNRRSQATETESTMHRFKYRIGNLFHLRVSLIS